MMPLMPGQGGGGPTVPGGGLIPPALPTVQPAVDPAMLAAMQGPTMMAPQPQDPAVYAAIMQMLGPGGGMGGMLGAPIGPAGMPASPAPPGQGQMMTPWQQALMGGGGQPGGGAAGIRGLPSQPGPY